MRPRTDRNSGIWARLGGRPCVSRTVEAVGGRMPVLSSIAATMRTWRHQTVTGTRKVPSQRVKQGPCRQKKGAGHKGPSGVAWAPPTSCAIERVAREIACGVLPDNWLANVRFGSKAVIRSRSAECPLYPQSGHSFAVSPMTAFDPKRTFRLEPLPTRTCRLNLQAASHPPLPSATGPR